MYDVSKARHVICLLNAVITPSLTHIVHTDVLHLMETHTEFTLRICLYT